jgi:WD40 repeat protein
MLRRPRTTPLLILALAVFLLGIAPAVTSAQTPYVPYFGKNRVKYDKFDWHIYQTDHFEIYFYPELEPHLERITSYLESAYQRISSELRHELPERAKVVIFKTQSEFQQQDISGEELPEGVLAFAEPYRDRLVFPIDEPPDQLYRLITHELTHIFEFDVIPRGLLGSSIPLWVDEGLANYMAGYWNVLDLMQVRDAALSDNVPRMSEFDAQPLSGRIPYSMGHAAFEFISSKWGQDGLRSFLFSLRKNIIGGGESAFEEALRLKPDEFDEEFDRYIKERFRPFRDKERPSDYGRDLAPRRDRTNYSTVLSIEPSPIGDTIAAVVGNTRDQELDIILLSAKDGQFIKNLTKGFDFNRGFEYISTAGGLRGNLVPWITWSPKNDRLAYFARTEKSKTLVIQDVVTGKTVQKIELKTVDGPESAAFSPDGMKVAFSGLQGAVGDIFVIDLSTRQITNVTKDAFADYAPAFSPDGQTIVYAARISGNDKLFKVSVNGGAKTQLTFGTHDDTAPKFLDANTLVFTSTATDPAVVLTPEVARNGNIPNVWTLDLKSNELKQWTDAAAGNVSAVPLPGTGPVHVAFVSYNKGANGIHIINREKPILAVPSSDFGAPAPVVDFQPPMSHTLVKDNVHRKGAFEKLMLDGRPPVNLGVTSGGDIFGGTQISFSDILGGKQVNFYAASVSQYRTLSLSYINIENRLQYALQAFSQDTFFYGDLANILYAQGYVPFIDRDQALSVRTQRGVTGFGIYPFNRYSRVELSGGFVNLKERYADEALQQISEDYQDQTFGTRIYQSGNLIPLGLQFVHETTVFREFGPLAGKTASIGFTWSPKFGGSFLDRRTVDADLRYYKRLGGSGVLAFRARGLRSWGTNPEFLFFGGNSELRGYEYLQFIGHKAFFGNVELRIPLIDAMATPLGVLGGIRGTGFFNIGGAGLNGQSFTPWSSKDEIITPIIGYEYNPVTGIYDPINGQTYVVSGFRLKDARASYGFGLESFFFGFPMHFDWSWKTLFNKGYEDLLFAASGGSAAFRKSKFSFWIGYDF